MTGPCDCCKPHERQGADRERKRIRRQVAFVMMALRRHGTGCDDRSEGKWFANLAEILDRSTRRDRGRK